jgi:hypothetical protein
MGRGFDGSSGGGGGEIDGQMTTVHEPERKRLDEAAVDYTHTD